MKKRTTFSSHSALLSGQVKIKGEFIQRQLDSQLEKIYYILMLDKYLMFGQKLNTQVIRQ